MGQYKSRAVTINRPATYIVDKFADLTSFGEAVERIPAAERAKLGDITFDKDSITLNTSQVGKIVFNVVRRDPERIEMDAVGAPVPLKLFVDLTDKGDETTEIITAVDVDIPPMLRPFVGGVLQKAVDQIGDMLVRLNS